MTEPTDAPLSVIDEIEKNLNSESPRPCRINTDGTVTWLDEPALTPLPDADVREKLRLCMEKFIIAETGIPAINGDFDYVRFRSDAGFVQWLASRLLDDLADTILAALPTLGLVRRPDVENTEPECHGLDTPDRVRFYEHDFYVLSNFSAFNLKWSGLTFATSEEAYHWEKFRSANGQKIRNQIYNAPSAHEAFKIAEANKIDRRDDWDEVKVSVMRQILRAKVEQHEYVRRKLLATGDRELVEDSWRDDFWGWGPNRDGQNMLGKLWMEVRSELRAALSSGELEK